MDDLTYNYQANTNKLTNVDDDINGIATNNYRSDIDDQGANNYTYDAIGNMIGDATVGNVISNISWTVYGKIESITKAGGTISYTYDAAGNRISKTVGTKTTVYVRDASGNVMAVYEAVGSEAPTQTEVHLYGSSRLGILMPHNEPNATNTVESEYGTARVGTFTRGDKNYELSNHLGNVLVTVSDKRIAISQTGLELSYYKANVVSAQDYYPFGMLMPGRSVSSTNGYRYGFNGKENDNEVKGEGVQLDYGFRIYDSRLGRFLSVDPLTETYPWYTPFQFAGNKPIWCIDLDGLEESLPKQHFSVPQLKNVSESTCIGCAERAKALLMNKKVADLEKLKTEYDSWKQKPENISKSVPPQYQSVAGQSPPSATISQGGIQATSEWQIAKARYDTYGKYLPGVSDIDDGLTLVSNLSDGQYKAAAFTALFFLPGGDLLKPLKNLKGAGKLGGTACMDFADAFMKKYSKKIEKAGGTATKMELKIGENGIIGTFDNQLSTNGIHQFIEVADLSGAVKIFDNAHPEGILKTDYIKSIAGSSTKIGVKEGQELLNLAKKAGP